MFRFKYCSNHYFSGCQNKPETLHNNKEMCLLCYAQLVYEDLEYGIKYGCGKKTYMLIHYQTAKNPKRAFQVKDLPIKKS